MDHISILLTASAALVAATNVITQVLKGFVTGEKKRRALTIAVSVVLVYVTLLIYSAVNPLTEWYIWCPGGIIGGIIIAYGAMYGYDNLYKDCLSKLTSILKGNTTEEE